MAESVAYRAELVVWMLTTTLPLVNMALWTAVVRGGGQVAGYTGAGFVAYYLAALLTRQLTGSWVLWEMNTEIRTGALSARLLRPIHPLFAYSAENLGAMPLRIIILVPLMMAALLFAPRGDVVVTHDPLLVGMFVLSLVSAWLITFGTMALMGVLGFYIESAMGAFEVWFAVYAIFSGYTVPLGVFPRWFAAVATYLPFRYQLGYPVELIVGRIPSRAEALTQLGVAYGWGIAIVLLAMLAFGRGLKKFAAFGS
jgi:ABC-2 type transport system permease protein